ncbi:sigma factor-like helix-turn-helix DNA-binding protein [Acutalibacter muris]|uniref:sigma factor-like helix-turn-helix DNA-binding protein n=1 Tax=Acutalibacter muris TaxID=1796620 RepID=UPI00272BCAB4|nr:hypothetical protein [Acutalibacter muris]
MSSAHLSELRLSLYVLKFIFDVHFPELCPSAHIAEGIGLSFQMGTFCNVGLFIPTGCRGPPQSIVLLTQNRLIGGITVEYTPKKVFVLENGTYLELSYAEFRQQKDTYHGRRFIPLHGMLMEVPEGDYKAFYKRKRREKYLKKRSKDNGDFSYDMLTTDDFNGEDILVDTISDTAGQAEKELLVDRLRQEIVLLSDSEQQLLHQFFNQQLSERAIANMYGVSQVAIHKQKARTLAKLKKLLKI